MANKQVGFECEFVEKPPKAFQSECPVCLLVLREPYQATCCGYAFCQDCIEKVQQNDKPCPCCNKTFDTFEDKRLKRSLYDFKVQCTNKQQGCQWEGELRQLDDHLNINPTKHKQLEGCQFSKIECLYCSDLFLRSDIQVHQSDQCPMRPFSCKYCKDFNSNHIDVTFIHWPVCGYYPLPCPNKCGETLQRQNLESHITNDCPLTIIDCDFQHVGCEVRLPRKDMPAHLQEDVVRHLSLQAACNNLDIKKLQDKTKKQQEEVARLEEENKQLKQQVEKLTQDLQTQKVYTPICPVEFTMTNFDQKRKDKERWQSPPFYTHVEGYRMCLHVYADGYASGAGTHVTTAIVMMKGEFDDQLQWPFRGKIDIQLLNQDRNEGHHTKTIDFDNDKAGESGNRVTEGEESNSKGGCHRYISHADLQPKYLNINNCLNFRIIYKEKDILLV